MKHYRILEIKNDQKQYVIQYLKPFFGLFFWKKANDIIYTKYDDALTEVKKIILKEDYDTLNTGYHYIDAFKLFKPKAKDVVKETTIETKIVSKKPIQKIKNKSVFIPKN